MKVTPGSVDVSLYVYFVDDDGGTAPGEPTIGLLFSDIETGGSASYMRQGADRTDFALVTLASASATHADGGFILVDDTNMPGVYRVDLPDAAFATGVGLVLIQLVAASGKNTVMRPLWVDLIIDAEDAVLDEQLSSHTIAGSVGAGLQGARTVVSGLAEAGTLSITQMTTDLTEATDGHYIGRVVIWLTGPLKDQASDITAYLGTTGMLTYSTVTDVPVAGNAFVIV